MRPEDFVLKNDDEIYDLDLYGTERPLPLLKFKALKDIDFIDHCFTTREGGYSSGMFKSMNFSYARGDDPGAVTANFAAVCDALHADIAKVRCLEQIHSAEVLYVDGNESVDGVSGRPFTQADGMITDVPGLVLATFHADCVPLYFVDTKHHAIGLSHSGWKGTVHRMGLATIKAMEERFGTDPRDLVCAIGPSICRDCYEVSKDVADEFIAEFPPHVDEVLVSKANGKYQLDLTRCNEIILREAGVPDEQIATTNICTCCNPELLFSHRASKGKRGTLGAFLTIKTEGKHNWNTTR